MSIKAIVEISFGSLYKYEHDKVNNVLVLDRPLNQAIPVNYGYIENTLAEDKDPLDIFVISDYPIRPLTQVKFDIIAAFKCLDSNVPDHKIVATLKDETHKSLDFYTDAIKQYLETYKKDFKVLEFVGRQEALDILVACQNSYTVNELSGNSR